MNEPHMMDKALALAVACWEQEGGWWTGNDELEEEVANYIKANKGWEYYRSMMF